MLSFFIVLPFGVRTNEEGSGERVPGHAESARHRFSFGRAALRATIVSAAAFLLFYLNYVYGWIGVSDLKQERLSALRQNRTAGELKGPLRSGPSLASLHAILSGF